MIIEDGTGSGYNAEVDSENFLHVHAVTTTAERHVNEEHGEAYHCLIDQSPTAGDDCIFYMENSDDKDMIIEGVWLSSTAACEIYFQLGDVGTRNAATDVVPANCNAGSGNAADGTFEYGADLDGGAATLAGGYEIERYVFRAANNSDHFNFEQDIIMPKNQTITMWCSAAAAVVNATFVFNYHAH